MSIVIKRNITTKVKVAHWQIGKAYIADAGHVYVPLNRGHILRISQEGKLEYVVIENMNDQALLTEVDLEISISKAQ